MCTEVEKRDYSLNKVNVMCEKFISCYVFIMFSVLAVSPEKVVL